MQRVSFPHGKHQYRLFRSAPMSARRFAWQACRANLNGACHITECILRWCAAACFACFSALGPPGQVSFWCYGYSETNQASHLAGTGQDCPIPAAQCAAMNAVKLPNARRLLLASEAFCPLEMRRRVDKGVDRLKAASKLKWKLNKFASFEPPNQR